MFSLNFIKRNSSFVIDFDPDLRHGSLVGSLSASMILILRSTVASGTFFVCEKKIPLPLIQEEQVVSYWQKNGHLILVSYLCEA